MTLTKDDIREILKSRVNAPPPLEAASKFLRIYFFDDSFEEARVHLERMARTNQRTILEGLVGIESLLNDLPKESGKLAQLVAVDANLDLDDPSDEGARQWLQEVVEAVREVLRGAQPPQSTDTIRAAR